MHVCSNFAAKPSHGKCAGECATHDPLPLGCRRPLCGGPCSMAKSDGASDGQHAMGGSVSTLLSIAACEGRLGAARRARFRPPARRIRQCRCRSDGRGDARPRLHSRYHALLQRHARAPDAGGHRRPRRYRPRAVLRQLYSEDAAGYLAHHPRAMANRGSLLVIGHNPMMEDLAMAVSGDGDEAARATLNRGFPTSGLAVDRVSTAACSQAAPGNGLSRSLPHARRRCS